jgi:hypothetical protein
VPISTSEAAVRGNGPSLRPGESRFRSNSDTEESEDVELLFLPSILLPGQCGSRCARVLIILDSNEMVPLAKR